ncbi:hypothetical protein AB4178_05355 [Vibrio splendidus]
MAYFLVKDKTITKSVHENVFSNTIEFMTYDIYVSGNLDWSNDENEGVLIVGSCLYYDKRLTADNVIKIGLDEIESNYNKLSGRYSIISLCESEIRILTSLFGTTSVYYSEGGKILSSNPWVIGELLGVKVNNNALNERLLFNTNYKHPLYENVDKLKSSSLSSFYNGELISRDLLCKLNWDYNDEVFFSSLLKIKSRTEKNLKNYNLKKVGIPYTSGRDSRLLLTQAVENIGREKCLAFTVGHKNDAEYYIGKKYTDYLSVRHELIKPSVLNENRIEKYTKLFNAVNFPCIYQVDLIESSLITGLDVLDTVLQEVLFSHMVYFSGKEHPAVNFIRNRSTTYKESDIKICDDFICKIEEQAIIEWDELRRRLPNDVITNIFFEMRTFQAGWVYSIMQPYEYRGNVICTFEDPIVLQILSSFSLEMFKNDYVYENFVDYCYPTMNIIPSTRNLNFATVLKKYFKYLPLYLRYLINPGSSSIHLSNNEKFIKFFVSKNWDILEVILSKGKIEKLKHSYNHEVYDKNRIEKMWTRLLGRNYISDEDMITPLCITSILKNNVK